MPAAIGREEEFADDQIDRDRAGAGEPAGASAPAKTGAPAKTDAAAGATGEAAKASGAAEANDAERVAAGRGAKRARAAAEDQPARRDGRPEAAAAPERHGPPRSIGQSADPAPERLPAVPDAPTAARPAASPSAIGAPTMAPPAELRKAIVEPAPASAVAEPAPAADAAFLPEPRVATMPRPSRSAIAAGMRLSGETIAFTWREAEHGLAAGRALMACRSPAELLALQAAYVGATLERTRAHSLELARLSSELLRAGLHPPRAE